MKALPRLSGLSLALLLTSLGPTLAGCRQRAPEPSSQATPPATPGPAPAAVGSGSSAGQGRAARATPPPATVPPPAPIPGARPTRLRVGDQVPDLRLSTHDGKSTSLRDHRGRWVLLWFYPAASTPGCTVEGQSLRDRIADFKLRNVQILGASVDAPAKNATFASDHGLPFPLLSDEGRLLAMSFGAADEPTASYARRVSALIDPAGVIRKLYPRVVPGTHAAEVLAELDTLLPKPVPEPHTH